MRINEWRDKGHVIAIAIAAPRTAPCSLGVCHSASSGRSFDLFTAVFTRLLCTDHAHLPYRLTHTSLSLSSRNIVSIEYIAGYCSMAAPAPQRPTAGTTTRKVSTMRPPTAPRPGANRAQTATPTLMNGRASPTESVASSRARTPKRKARDEMEEGAEETNINVVVRCRGRNDREVRENSGVVVSTEGIKGKKVELSMGPSALSNKTYQFDKVFSPAADQGIVFDEVVTPMVDEVC